MYTKVKKSKFRNGTKYIFLVILAIIIIFPVYIALTNSFKTERNIFSDPIGIPETFEFGNYIAAWGETGMGNLISNSILITTGSVVLIMIVCTIASYALAGFRFKMNNILFYVFLAGLIVPPQLIGLPILIQIRNLHLYDNYLGLILVYTGMLIPFTMLILINFFKQIPQEIVDAGIVDGANPFQIFIKLVLPLSKAPISAVTIYSALYVWNDLLFPLLLLSGGKSRTVTLGIYLFVGGERILWPYVFAALVMAIMPIIILFIVLQRYFEQGLMIGYAKG